jgi:lipopolysaccharide biosynthesis glycosyltransferase
MELKKIVEKQDPNSSITFLEANNDFNKSYFDKFTVGIYYRLMLPKLLLHLDKIIYSDVDVIFCNDMIEADKIDVNNCWIAGVKDAFNLNKSEKRKKMKYKSLDDHQYLCSGFLLMNLKMLREQDIYNRWVELSKNKSFNYPDQDILNCTCQDRKLSIPLKYSFIPMGEKSYNQCIKDNIYSHQEYEDATNNPINIHYAGRKPWNNTVSLFEIWWKYAAMTPFLDIFLLRHNVPFATFEKKFYLFHFIPFLRTKFMGNKVKYYLFGFIPLLKIKNFT